MIRLDSHTAFSRACNRAARTQPNDYYLLLNNDVLLAEGTLASMVAVLNEDPGIGICGSRLLFPDRTIQHCGVVFGGGEQGPYHCFRHQPTHIVPRGRQPFQAVTGACLLVRQQVWRQLGGLDEAYDFGLEDIDFCLRARQQGWKIVCANDTDSLHFEALTPGRVERDIPSRRLFMERWQGRYCLDG